MTRRDDGETIKHYIGTDVTGQPFEVQYVRLEAIDIGLDNFGTVCLYAGGSGNVMYEISDSGTGILDPPTATHRAPEPTTGRCYVCGAPASITVPMALPEGAVVCDACFDQTVDDYQSEG